MFRNVRTEPRKFSFHSRHLPELDDAWLQRKERVEQEVQGADGATRRNIRMRRGSSSNGSERLERRTAQIKSTRWAMLRAALIAVGLVWLAWKGLQWVEKSDFSGVLKWMENA
tara:strand:+ start:2517 stop:2855 length:339 start_codon:yes stop_codon:yes gene_type:complete